MPISEVFPNPTVKQVIFQITFPNLFFLESKIGEFQMRIMEKFPESSLVFQRQVVFAMGEQDKINEIQQGIQQEQGTKIWKFNNPSLGYELNVSGDSVGIVSGFHKTYNNHQSENKFRDIIKYVLIPFFEITHLPIVSRIGLRYIDECYFKQKTTKSFTSHFNSCFKTKRFSIENSVEHQYVAMMEKDDYFIRYVESYNAKHNPLMLILDFDAFATNIKSETCMDVTDVLHDIISTEYESTIKKPIYDQMKKVTHGK